MVLFGRAILHNLSTFPAKTDYFCLTVRSKGIIFVPPNAYWHSDSPNGRKQHNMSPFSWKVAITVQINNTNVHQMDKSVTASVTIRVYRSIYMIVMCTQPFNQTRHKFAIICWGCRVSKFDYCSMAANSCRNWAGLRQSCSDMQEIWPDNSLHSDT